MRHMYSPIEDSWLKENIASCRSYNHLTDMFNKEFNCSVSAVSVIQRCVKFLKLSRGAYIKYHKFSPEEDKWLKANIKKCNSYKHLTEMFNKEFNCCVSSVQDRCTKQLHIHRETNTGMFRGGEVHSHTYKLGDEREYDGYIWVKTNDIQHKGKVTSAMFRENWTPKQRFVYEQAYGKIPEGHIVVFLDSNKRNFSLDNLYCIPRRINVIMNQNKWFTTSKEHTLAAIKWCELFYALKENTKPLKLLERS